MQNAAKPEAMSANRRPKLIVHLGTQKTGSTALQSYLSTNHEALYKSGLAYGNLLIPQKDGTRGALCENAKRGHINAFFRKSHKFLDFGKASEIVHAEIQRMMNSRRPSNILLSEENFYRSLYVEREEGSNLKTDSLLGEFPDDSTHENALPNGAHQLAAAHLLEALKHFFGEHCSAIHSILCVRSQSEVMSSVYAQYLNAGCKRIRGNEVLAIDDFSKRHGKTNPWFDYNMNTQEMIRVFGDYTLFVLDDMPRGGMGVIRSFAECIGFSPALEAPRSLNKSMEGAAQIALLKLYRKAIKESWEWSRVKPGWNFLRGFREGPKLDVSPKEKQILFEFWEDSSKNLIDVAGLPQDSALAAPPVKGFRYLQPDSTRINELYMAALSHCESPLTQDL